MADAASRLGPFVRKYLIAILAVVLATLGAVEVVLAARKRAASLGSTATGLRGLPPYGPPPSIEKSFDRFTNRTTWMTKVIPTDNKEYSITFAAWDSMQVPPIAPTEVAMVIARTGTNPIIGEAVAVIADGKILPVHDVKHLGATDDGTSHDDTYWFRWNTRDYLDFCNAKSEAIIRISEQELGISAEIRSNLLDLAKTFPR